MRLAISGIVAAFGVVALMPVALLCATTTAVLADAENASGAQRAVWTPKKLHFVYQGFTTHYSCEGLQDKVKKALLELGARKDLKVREGACSRPGGGPEPFPNVDVSMNVLEPESGSSADDKTKPVSAHWKMIDLKLDPDALSEAADCELLEQIKHSFLPLFATRNVDYHSTCVAHQVTPGGTWLRAEVLLPDPPGAQVAKEGSRP
jgi:hypothetical protein